MTPPCNICKMQPADAHGICVVCAWTTDHVLPRPSTSDPLSQARIEEVRDNINAAVRACTLPVNVQQMRSFKFRETMLALIAERALNLRGYRLRGEPGFSECGGGPDLCGGCDECLRRQGQP